MEGDCKLVVARGGSFAPGPWIHYFSDPAPQLVFTFKARTFPPPPKQRVSQLSVHCQSFSLSSHRLLSSPALLKATTATKLSAVTASTAAQELFSALLAANFCKPRVPLSAREEWGVFAPSVLRPLSTLTASPPSQGRSRAEVLCSCSRSPPPQKLPSG